MSSDNDLRISVLTAAAERDAQSVSMFPSPTRVLAQVHEVAVSALASNLTTAISSLSSILDAVPDHSSRFKVESVTFALTVDGSGKISLIGELAAGVSSAITVTLRRTE